MTSVLLIDDHPIVLQGVEQSLKEFGVRTVYACASFAEGFRQYRKHKPDLIVLDLAVKSDALGGLSFLRRLRMHDTKTPILVFSMYEDPLIVSRAIETGATGYILKLAWHEEFKAAFDQIQQGRRYLSHELASEIAFMNQKAENNPLQDLSLRELRVLKLISQGTSYSAIASELNVSYKTVANTAAQIKSKLNAQSLIELAQLADRHMPLLNRARQKENGNT